MQVPLLQQPEDPAQDVVALVLEMAELRGIEYQVARDPAVEIGLRACLGLDLEIERVTISAPPRSSTRTGADDEAAGLEKGASLAAEPGVDPTGAHRVQDLFE